MIYLTRQEKYFLAVLSLILFCGVSLLLCFKKYPKVLSITEFIDSPHSFLQIDVNRATKDELLAIPYIGEYTARKILDYRQEHGRFESIEQLRDLKGIHKNSYYHFSKYLKVGP